MQVGANDGVSHGDVVYPAFKKHGNVQVRAELRRAPTGRVQALDRNPSHRTLQGMLFEPQPDVYKTLSDNYAFAANRTVLLNYAISGLERSSHSGIALMRLLCRVLVRYRVWRGALTLEFALARLLCRVFAAIV